MHAVGPHLEAMHFPRSLHALRQEAGFEVMIVASISERNIGEVYEIEIPFLRGSSANCKIKSEVSKQEFWDYCLSQPYRQEFLDHAAKHPMPGSLRFYEVWVD